MLEMKKSLLFVFSCLILSSLSSCSLSRSQSSSAKSTQQQWTKECNAFRCVQPFQYCVEKFCCDSRKSCGDCVRDYFGECEPCFKSLASFVDANKNGDLIMMDSCNKNNNLHSLGCNFACIINGKLSGRCEDGVCSCVAPVITTTTVRPTTRPPNTQYKVKYSQTLSSTFGFKQVVQLADNRLATVTNQVAVWSSELAHQRDLEVKATPYSLEKLPNGNLVVGQSKGIVAIYTLKTYSVVAILEEVGYTSAVDSLALLYSSKIAIGSKSELRIWDGKSSQATKVSSDCARLLSASKTKNIFASSCPGSSEIKIWDSTSGAALHTINDPDRSEILTIEILDDNRLLVGHKKGINAWNLNQSPPLKLSNPSYSLPDTDINSIKELSRNRIAAAAVINTATRQHVTYIFDLLTNKMQQLESIHADTIQSLAVMANDELVSVGKDKKIAIYYA